MATTQEIWKKLTTMNDRLYTVETRVATLGESVDRIEGSQKDMVKKIEELGEKHHALDTKHQVSMAQMTLVFSIIAFVGATIGGIIIKSSFDNLKTAITQQNNQR